MKKNFFHNEAIIKRGNPINSFFIVLSGKGLVLNSNGNKTIREIEKNQVFGLIDTLKEKKWKNTVVSDKNSEILFISRQILIKNLFSFNAISDLSLNLLKMAN